jgi:hypothetical protein
MVANENFQTERIRILPQSRSLQPKRTFVNNYLGVSRNEANLCCRYFCNANISGLFQSKLGPKPYVSILHHIVNAVSRIWTGWIGKSLSCLPRLLSLAGNPANYCPQSKFTWIKRVHFQILGSGLYEISLLFWISSALFHLVYVSLLANLNELF